MTRTATNPATHQGPAAALVVAAVAVKEGRESWRGEGCCVSC